MKRAIVLAVIIKHLAGNMLSRWTDIFTTDGEKKIGETAMQNLKMIFSPKAELMAFWDKGWNVFQTTLESLKRRRFGENHLYPESGTYSFRSYQQTTCPLSQYHVGQIVFIEK